MPTRQRLLLLGLPFALFLCANTAAAQCQVSPGLIGNFRTVTFVNTQWTFAWDAPAGAAPGASYEVVEETGPDYCNIGPAQTVLATTTSTQYTASLSTPDIAYGFFIRLASDHCVTTAFRYVSDTFSTAPAKPPRPTVTPGPSTATVTFSYDDGKSFDVSIQRAGADGQFVQVGTAFTCNPDPKTFTDKNVPNGTYQYRLVSSDFAADVAGDPVTVTVGANATPLTATMTGTPLVIRLGQPATLTWTSTGATSATIDNGVGSVSLSGSATVTPSVTTNYTLNATNGATTASSTVTIEVITQPVVVVGSAPAPLVQNANSAGATTSYTLMNAGGSPTTVALSQNGSFFTQSPASFTLAPGASQLITITGLPQRAGAYEGASIPSGNGVERGLSIKVKLLSAAVPAGPVTGKPATNRVDVAAAAGTNPTGTVTFTNSGSGTLTGVLVSDAAWIIPQAGLITIAPGGSVTVTFTVDRSQRPDASTLIGSAAGKISLVYPTGAPGSLDVTPVTGVSIVTVVDTVQLTVTQGTVPPPLAPGEVALFVPGAGHVTGSVGTFISDVSVTNPFNTSINDLKFYFTPTNAATGSSATLPPVGNISVSLADVVKNVFADDAHLGTLQIRSESAATISVNTDIFNTSSPAGTYGTTIPTFRSDHGVIAGDHLTLTGLRQDATGHTNLFIQETSGAGVSVKTEFLDANGVTLATRSDTVGPFAVALVSGAVPQGAVAAVLTNMSSGNATFLAYATPVDEASHDNWSIVDWSRQYGYSGSDPVVVPVAGLLHGANNTLFRSDISITNTGSGSATGTLRFYPRGGTPIDRQITLGSRQTQGLPNVIGTLFNAPDGSVGYLLFTPSTGTFVMTSRTYTTVAGSVATFGTHVPTVPASASSRLGSLRAIGSLQDSSIASITGARPATFRTNFGLLETSGTSVTVRVTLRYSYDAGVKVQAFGSASKDYTLSANEFRQINGIAADILGSSRDALGDLHDLEADFQVVSGSGAVVVYTSSTDNGTGDVILRME